MKKLRCSLILLTCVLFVKNVCAGSLVQFSIFLGSTTYYLGDVDVELYDQDKPNTVKNFLRLVQSGAYQYSFFHRCEPGFVLQGGGFTVGNPFDLNTMAPPYSDLFSVPNFGSISNEFKTGTFRSNIAGTIAMAKSSDPNSANSQFFFNLANNSASLDNTNNSGGFTVFGHVLRGMDVLNNFNVLFYGYYLVDLTKNYGSNGVTSLFYELPNANIGTNAPRYTDLAFFIVNPLSPQLKLQTNGSRQITWKTISGLTNSVEYTTNLPPSWQVLTNVIGTGAVTNITDSTTNNTRRFYRVHVLY